MESLVELVEILSNADAVPGREDEVRDIFEARWRDIAELAHDRLGGVVAEVSAGDRGAPRVVVESHLDEVGFMVRLITKMGLLKVVPLGGFWAQALPGKRLRIVSAKGSKVPGVIGAIPPHLLGRDKDRVVDVKELLVDVGARDGDDARAMGLAPGCFAVPDSTFTPLTGGHRVSGKAFDNRVGCAVCLRTVERAHREKETGAGLPCTVVGVGSVQEEVGLRGVRVSMDVARPDVAIVVEGAPADDVVSGKDEAQGSLGCGVQIRAFDPTMVASPRLLQLALEAAEGGEIPYQLAVRTSGGTDAGRLHLHARGVPTLVLAVPVRYAHSHVGVIDVGDLEAMERLVWALLERLDSRALEDRLLPWTKP